MKKVNNSEDIKDDSDELRKKKSTADTDQMVPVPENRPFHKEECENIRSNDEKNNDISFPNTECNKVLESHDPLFANSMYEDVNSPEDFDDYDNESVLEDCSARNTTEDSCHAVESLEENCGVLENIQKCYDVVETVQTCFIAEELLQNSVDAEKTVSDCFDAGESVQNCFDAGESVQNCFGTGESVQNCFDAGESVQNSFDAGESEQNSFDAGESVQNCFDAGESVQNCFDARETVQNCFDAGESVQGCFDAGESIQNCFDAGESIQNCFDAGESIQNCFDAETTQDVDAIETAQDHFSAAGETSPECFVSVVEDCFDEGETEEGCGDASEPAEDSKADYEEENFVEQETFNIGEASVSYDQDRGSESCTAESIEEPFVLEESSLQPPEVDLTCSQMSPVAGAASSVRSDASVEDNVDGKDINEQEETEEEKEEEERGDIEVIKYTFNTEEGDMNDVTEPEDNFVDAPVERGVVPEVEDVTCDSGGESVLHTNHKICSEVCDVSKPNVCTEEEMMYTDHLNSVQSVDEMIFHKRSTVIDMGNACASLHVRDSSAMRSRNNSLVCELPQREAAVLRYCEDYGATGVSSVFPKRVCNSVCISPIPPPPVRELYVYDPSAQNMTFCRSSSIIDARSLPVNQNLNGLDSYSFHQIPIESSSGIKNINDAYGHTNSGLCPVLQEPTYEFDNRDMKPPRKLPTQEDFMRKIEKTLLESKIETKINNTIDSKYKAELDLSLPLKKRLRTLAAMSSISCTPEKFVTPKEESFPSYPAKPMISIAELEFTEGLIPKPGKTYQDSYK